MYLHRLETTKQNICLDPCGLKLKNNCNQLMMAWDTDSCSSGVRMIQQLQHENHPHHLWVEHSTAWNHHTKSNRKPTWSKMDTVVCLSPSLSPAPSKSALGTQAFKILHFVLANPYIYWPHQIHWKFQLQTFGGIPWVTKGPCKLWESTFNKMPQHASLEAKFIQIKHLQPFVVQGNIWPSCHSNCSMTTFFVSVRYQGHAGHCRGVDVQHDNKALVQGSIRSAKHHKDVVLLINEIILIMAYYNPHITGVA